MPRKPVPRSVVRDGKKIASHSGQTIGANKLTSPLVKQVLHVQHQLANGSARSVHKQVRNRWSPVHSNFRERLKAGTLRPVDVDNIQSLLKSEFSHIRKPSDSARLHV